MNVTEASAMQPQSQSTGIAFDNEEDEDEVIDDEDDDATLNGVDANLENGPNPWLPAYGFQLQHHSHYQPSNEDIRANDTMVVQQVDFLETILEETSDDLQSDSDRSAATYWMSSDSETESVIHIRTKQRSAEDEKHDGSGSESNSVVPKKRRRRNNGTSDRDHHQVTFEDYPMSPRSSRSSRSSGSSRSSSLLQFETLERTCATLSPSSYSFDSLEYSNRSNHSHLENTSPDSLEENYGLDRIVPNGLDNDGFRRIRPYRSFESLDACQKDDDQAHCLGLNGFAPLYQKRNAEVDTRLVRRPRDFWHENEYEDDDEDDEEDDRIINEDRNYEDRSYDDRILVFGDPSCNYATLDYRNTIDLREIGVETKHDTLMELKSGQAAVSTSLRLLQARLNIASTGCGGGGGGGNMASERHRHHHHQQQSYEHGEGLGWSEEEGLNFRYTDKSQSAPSLPGSVDESAHERHTLGTARASSRPTSLVSTLNLFENYTKVASLPVDLNLCGIDNDDNVCDKMNNETTNDREMSETNEKVTNDLAGLLKSKCDIEDAKSSLKSVRTQAPQIALSANTTLNSLENGKEAEKEKEMENDEDSESEIIFEDENDRGRNPVVRVPSTVKTQDFTGDVLQIAIAIENKADAAVDEAMKRFNLDEKGDPGQAQFKSPREKSDLVKKNASYELAQQWAFDENHVRRILETYERPQVPARKRVMNNASYELAQQCDYIKSLQKHRGAFQRMDACDELEEYARNNSAGGSASNIVDRTNDNYNSRVYSRSSENVSHRSPDAKRRPDKSPESIFDQIKKNSDLFSIYGEGGNNRALIYDEVDYSCLESKPIASANASFSRETTHTSESSEIRYIDDRSTSTDFLDESADRSTTTSRSRGVSTRSERSPSTGSTSSKKSFISEFYPEMMARLRQQEELLTTRGSVSPSSWSCRDDETSDSRSEGTQTGEQRLWRVVVERRDEMEEEREKVVARRSSPPAPSLESWSGNPAATRTAPSNAPVDTNHRGNRDKRREESKPVVVSVDKALTMSSSPTTTPTGTLTSSTPKSGNARKFVVPSLRRDSSKNNEQSSANAEPSLPKCEERKKSGLGGFLQRFSRLRFSGRSKVPRSEVQKKSTESSQVTRAKVTEERVKTKEPDYIIIPLHPPEEEEKRKNKAIDGANDDSTGRIDDEEFERCLAVRGINGRAPVSSKPPLPPQAPVNRATFGASSCGNVQYHRNQQGVCANGDATALPSSSSSTRRRAATDLGSPAAIEMAKARAMQREQHHRRPVGLLETDLDDEACLTTRTTTLTVVNGRRRDNDEDVNDADGKKTRSLLNLSRTIAGATPCRPDNVLSVTLAADPSACRDEQDDPSRVNHRPHKSMEFLLDKENLHFVKPPENELQKVGERTPSEHELRVQRSLQRLNVPDWYKNSPAARDGFRLKRHSDASQHGGWRSLGSKTTSLSSLSSSSTRQPTTGVLLSPSPTPPVFSRWSTSLLNSAGSSPASSARSSFNHRQPYLGWRSQERLANPRTPAERLAQGMLPQLQNANKQQQQQTTNQQLEVRNSIKEVTSAIVHYVQSGQEVGGGGRLSPRPDNFDDRGGARSTSPRGSGRMCWMESSFVGTKPMDSPETPMSLATDTECCVTCKGSCTCVNSTASGLFLNLTPTRDDGHHLTTDTGGLSPSMANKHRHHRRQQQQQQQTQQRHHRGTGQYDTDEAMATAALLRNKPSPGSTTLEDVLDSLLGLPSASRTPSPGPLPAGGIQTARRANQANAGKSCSDLRQDLQASARSVLDVQTLDERASSYLSGELVRRKSEGSDTLPPRGALMLGTRTGNLRHRRVSFDNGQENGLGGSLTERLIRCRNNKCSNSASLAEARKTYKSCHNCTCLYCSRECRRAHWERHRRTCLHSRAGSLCKQVLSSAKEDPATLKHISTLARRGYLSDGRGAVKCFFTCPEQAERFVEKGFAELGEPTYVRLSDLLPSEMGPELYAEVVRLCESYNPDARMVLYVAICVVIEVPTSCTGAVSWERQLVSRCAKVRLEGAPRHQSSSSISASPQSRHHTTSPCNITREMDSPETLILTSLPGSDGQNTPKRIREVSFGNIQKQLRLRGVSLRRHFPQVYRKLCSYVDGSVDKFAPVTIYPRDQASGKSFMCIIMLDAEPERLQLLPTDSSRVRTVDISVDQE